MKKEWRWHFRHQSGHWIAEDGSITWTADGSNVTPVGYTEPTEFQEKSAASDPANARECVGAYTFGEDPSLILG